MTSAWRCSLALVAMLVFALTWQVCCWPGGSAGHAAAAFAATPPGDAADLATHPIVGAWIPSASPAGPPTYEVFHADGTYTNVNSWNGTAVGVWRAIDDQSVEFIAVAPNRNQAPGAYREGRTLFRGVVAVADDGSTYSGTYHIQQSSTTGAPLVEVYEGTVTGTRITLDQAGATPPA